MIYKNNEIPSEYNKIAEYNNNYIVWVKESILNSGTSYNAYIQYMIPSFSYYFTDDYKIKNGDTYILNANYNNNGVYNYLDSYDIDYSLTTQLIDNDYITTNEYNRSDFCSFFVCQFIFVIMFLWVFKQLSRLFFKGGLY